MLGGPVVVVHKQKTWDRGLPAAKEHTMTQGNGPPNVHIDPRGNLKHEYKLSDSPNFEFWEIHWYCLLSD